MRNRGLYQAGVIAAGQRVKFGKVFTSITAQKGEFQEATVVPDVTKHEDGFLYVFSSELSYKTFETTDSRTTKAQTFASRQSRRFS